MAQTRNIIFVDLDRTLFDTDRFYAEVWRVLGERHGFDGDAAQKRVKEFYYEVRAGYHYDYGFHNHLAAYIPQVSVPQAMAEVYDALKNTSFLYDDATELFGWQPSYDVHVLTFGETDRQQFKLRFCELLAPLPTHIILEPKAQFIAANFPNRHGLLIDDKIEGDLPPYIKQIHIDRQSGVAISRKSAIILVNSLKQVTPLL